jgi:hypothetical protein
MQISIPSVVLDNIRIFVKLTGLRQGEDQVEIKYARDEFDLVDALQLIPNIVKSTKRIFGSKMYNNKEYDLVLDVSRDLEEVLLIGETDQETAGKRRKNLRMYHLVVGPAMDALRSVSHLDAVAGIDSYINTITDHIMNHNYTAN